MRYHFIAIGGSVMHSLALSLHHKGHTITGSDDKLFDPSRTRLAEQGLLPEKEGWFPEKITPEIDAVVLGMHAKRDNPELVKALELGIQAISYPEFILELTKDKTRVVIGGSHGKTTITAMIIHVLKFYEKEFDYLVGAQLDGIENPVQISDAPIIVIEGDEYFASSLDMRPKFHLYQPHIALISGIAWDHINVFPSREDYLEQFRIFVSTIEDVGTLIYNATDEDVERIALAESKRLFLLPYRPIPYEIKNGVSVIPFNGVNYELNIFGRHNLMNMEGARKICRRLGINNRKFFKAMKSFDGASNRLETIRTTKKGTVFRDFAHAPSKLEATVEAVKRQFNAPLVAVFELHTYSSLNPEFLPEYRKTMQEADIAIIYFNEETLALKKLPELTKDQVKSHFGRKDNFEVFVSIENLVAYLKRIDFPSFNLLMMSSGNFGGLNIPALAKDLFPE
jgi:UDP-N-acetylmuramate: L-alanyl-gamma-D-glutamyl-meso-diaminopimelate ligase